MSFDNIKKLLQDNQSERLSKEQKERSDKPRHTVYKGNRTIQQLGDQPIENSVVINNQSLAIGDVMLPLAKGNVLRRVDNTNGGALLGSSYRDALENDFDANGRRRGSGLGRNGGIEPNDPSSTNRPRRRPSRFPPPFGCTPPPASCFWSNDPVAPSGYQGYGSAVINENGVPLYLHCVAGTSAPQNLGCSFLDPQRWRCVNGVCVPDPLGVYSSKAQCEAALIQPNFTGGQCPFIYESIFVVRNSVNNQTNSVNRGNIFAIAGAIVSLGFEPVPPSNSLWRIKATNNLGATAFYAVTGAAGIRDFGGGIISTLSFDNFQWVPRNPLDIDNCGNPSPTCPP